MGVDRAGIDTGEHPGDRRCHDGAGREQPVAGLHVVAGAPHGGTGLDAGVDPHPIVGQPLGLLDHHDRVAAVGQRCPRHDPDRLARLEDVIGGSSRRHLADDRQLDRRVVRVGGDHGVPVDGRVVERWNLFAGDHVGGQHESLGVVERHLDRGPGRAAADHERLGVFERCHTAHGTGRRIVAADWNGERRSAGTLTAAASVPGRRLPSALGHVGRTPR